MSPLGSLGPEELQRRLQSRQGLRLCTGPFVFNVRSRVPAVADGLALHYGRHAVLDTQEDGFCDFHITVNPPSTLRRFFRPQVEFRFDGDSPFLPLPGHQGFPMLEWGMNWSISAHAHHFVIVHAAVLERQGRALVMPAPPGCGKSTLCAALALSGWRLMSDELALIDPHTCRVWALARPVSLKNGSIDIISRFSTAAVVGPPVAETVKGVVAHMCPPAKAVQQVHDTAMPGWLVLPRYIAGHRAELRPLSRAQAFMGLQRNTFNYDLHGYTAFETLGRVVQRSHCFEYHYSRLDDAIADFDALEPPP